ncbi:MAG TPA: cytochrome P450 [Rubrobacteraceae bacterium]
MAQTPQVDLFDPTFKANPYPTYAELRSEAPVYRAELPDGRGVWLVTRYDDVVAVLKDERFAKDWRSAMTPEQLTQIPPIPEVMKPLSENMLDKDPPDHERLRRLVSKAFTPRLIERMRPRVQEIADTLLDAVKTKDKGGMDLIDDYAFPLPITVIAELLGVPVEDRNRFREWSDAAVSGDTTQEYVEKILLPHMQAFIDYLRALFEEKRDNPKDDLISALVLAEEAGDRLSEDELLAMVFLLLVAGHETTVNLIGNGTLALLQNPDQLQKLRDDPSLIKPAIEELLRYDGPVETSTERFAREDVAIGDTVIPKGEMVMIVIAAADHDPERFPEPDALDIARADNRHLAFGKGIHHCLGAPLARMEGQIALGTLLRRMPDLRLKGSPESLTWRPGMVLRGLKGLPVAF